MKIAIAQLHFIVGDIFQNQQKILNAMQQAENASADLLIFPELALTGYLAEDLFLRQDFLHKVQTALQMIQQSSGNTLTVLGVPQYASDTLYNSAVFIQHQKIIASYAKQILPNEGVFDEKRYFSRGSTPCVFNVKNKKMGLLICEDAWHDEPFIALKAADVDCVVIMNASPFDIGKDARRKNVLQAKAQHFGYEIVYVNTVGGHDDIVFDGGSFWMRADGTVAWQAPFFENHFTVLDSKAMLSMSVVTLVDDLALVYQGLCSAIRDYVHDNGFKKVCLGLSGGIDSALVLALACDALGSDAVSAVMMPSQYTSDESRRDAKALALNLSVDYREIFIADAYASLAQALFFLDIEGDLTAQNIQARIRGLLLMAISNKTGALLLSTSNKSEMAVGYATLYGDMAGAFAVLKDVPKTLVYRLAHYRQARDNIFPLFILERPPSAELAPDQRDEDHLPPYEILDRLIECYIDQDLSVETILAMPENFDRDQVMDVIQRIYQSEYKRRQSPPGPKITPRAFGRERRYPLTMGKWYL